MIFLHSLDSICLFLILFLKKIEGTFQLSYLLLIVSFHFGYLFFI